MEKSNDGTKGGLLVGKTDKNGGNGIPALVGTEKRPIIMGGGEAVLTENTMSSDKKYSLDGKEVTACEIADKINRDGGGVAIDCNAQKTANKGRFDDGGRLGGEFENWNTGFVTKSGIPYTEDITSWKGASFILYPLLSSTDEDIKKAKSEIRFNQDVVSLSIADENDKDDLYKSMYFKDVRTRPLKWYQIEQNKRLIRKARKSGMSPTEFVDVYVLPRVKEVEKENLKERGEGMYSFENGGGVDQKDSVSMDIPLLIRTLELAREDIKSDADLHRMVERLIELKDKGTLTMDDYEFIEGVKQNPIVKMAKGGDVQSIALEKSWRDELNKNGVSDKSKKLQKQLYEYNKNNFPVVIEHIQGIDYLSKKPYDYGQIDWSQVSGWTDSSVFYDVVKGRYVPNEIGKEVGIRHSRGGGSAFEDFNHTPKNVKIVKDTLQKAGYKVEVQNKYEGGGSCGCRHSQMAKGGEVLSHEQKLANRIVNLSRKMEQYKTILSKFYVRKVVPNPSGASANTIDGKFYHPNELRSMEQSIDDYEVDIAEAKAELKQIEGKNYEKEIAKANARRSVARLSKK